ncbi:hypothetical protein SNEBB_000663 [Seison nebaliae]|nr:hypothetical protein SNEBB_000663 [Seison nebaliae]
MDSNKIRLNKLKLVNDEINERKNVINSLLNEPQNFKKNHMKFDSEDEEMKEECNSNNKKQLFNDDDDEEEDNFRDKISEKTNENKKMSIEDGQKMMELQNKIGFDSRFKLTKSFLENHKIVDESEKDIDEEIHEENESSLKMMSEISGSEMKKMKKKVNSKSMTPMNRFDPLLQQFNLNQKKVEEKQSMNDENSSKKNQKRKKKKGKSEENGSNKKMKVVVNNPLAISIKSEEDFKFGFSLASQSTENSSNSQPSENEKNIEKKSNDKFNEIYESLTEPVEDWYNQKVTDIILPKEDVNSKKSLINDDGNDNDNDISRISFVRDSTEETGNKINETRKRNEPTTKRMFRYMTYFDECEDNYPFPLKEVVDVEEFEGSYQKFREKKKDQWRKSGESEQAGVDDEMDGEDVIMTKKEKLTKDKEEKKNSKKIRSFIANFDELEEYMRNHQTRQKKMISLMKNRIKTAQYNQPKN